MKSLVELINGNLKGASFISIDMITDPRLTGGRRNPFKDRTSKITTGASVMIAQSKYSSAYGNMVKRRLEKEGKNPEDFILGPRVWGTRIEGTPFIRHTPQKSTTEQYYLELIFFKPGITHYEVDGVITPPNQIQGLPIKNEGEQGGLEDKVIIRTVNIDNITGIRAFGEEHTELYFDINELETN